VDIDSKAPIQLFCFPYGGGAGYIFRNWEAGLPPEVRVSPVDFPGRGRRICERLVRRIDVLVEDLAGLLSGRLGEPFAFFGHSLGGLVAFELARFLRRHARCEPVHLFVSATLAPHEVGVREPMHHLPDPEFWRRVSNLNGTPRDVLDSSDIREMMLPILRADMEAYETYGYTEEAPLSCPITAFGGQFDPEVLEAHVSGWRHHSAGPFRQLMFAGDHFFLRECEPAVIRAVRNELGRSDGSRSPGSTERLCGPNLIGLRAGTAHGDTR
jgi:medium-chain acyl-[acyl-carrier-protein] hydrolase